MTENKNVKVKIEIPSQLYGAIELYFHEPHETIEECIIELIKEGINATSEKQWQATRSTKP
jgi:hypothetical protein